MGKGKGSFDHWAARVAVNQVLFEIRGQLHEAVIRDAFRLAGQKLPGKSGIQDTYHRYTNFTTGQYEFIKKGDPPVVGITKLKDGMTIEDLKRPWKNIEPPSSSTTSSTTAAP